MEILKERLFLLYESIYPISIVYIFDMYKVLYLENI